MRVQKAGQAVLLAVALLASTAGVASAASCEGKKKKGCEVPETPYVAFLPVVTTVGVAGLYVFQRRRGMIPSAGDAGADGDHD